MIDQFIFMILPYLALITLLTGSFFVIRRLSYRVTALSTQIIESKLLFFGSMFMHWGVIILFLGHLTGFLIPSRIMIWNGNPLRLMILEITALIMGLMFFAGLCILFYRRIKYQALHRLTSNIDLIVYIILFTQAITGLLIAMTLPWGSSWYVSVLTPYLRSLFVLQPDIAAVAAMPLIVKIHISAAFILIGMIPFSRFMHFMVFPVQYLGRKNQVFIWNRNKAVIRNSTHIAPEVKAKNN